MPSLTAVAAFVLSHALCGVADAAEAAEQAKAAQDAAAADAGSAPTFDVEAYDVDGNSLLDTLTIEKAVYPHLGPARSKTDIDNARQALEDAYHKRGYDSVVVEVPAQTVADHVVRLHVVETTVGRLRVTGTRFYSVEDVKRQTPALAEGASPNFQVAAAEIADLNRESGRQVTPLVQPGKAPGTVDVDLKVTETEPLHASLELTNDHPVDTTPLRLTATLRYDNLWQRGHTVSVSYAVAPEDRAQSQVFAGSYLALVPQSRWSILLYGYQSNSNVATLGDVTVLGKGYAIGMRGIDQLPPLGPVTQTLSVGFDFKHFYQLLASASTTAAPTESAVDYWPLTAVYSVQLDTAASSTHASLGATAGLRTAARAEYVFQVNRAYADGNFIHVNLDVDHTRNLPLGLVGDVHLTAQASNQPLLSGEQVSAGGLSSVRGYLQSAAVGDQGVVASLELRSPLINVAPRRWLDDWRMFGFGDFGQTWLEKPLADQKSQTLLYSAGLGARFQLFERLNGNVVLGVPLAAVRGIDVGRPYTLVSLKSGF